MRQPELGDLQRGLELACQGRALTQAPTCMGLRSSCRGQGHLSSSGSLVVAGFSLWPGPQLLLALPGRRYEQAFGRCPPSRTFSTHKTRVSCGLLHCPGEHLRTPVSPKVPPQSPLHEFPHLLHCCLGTRLSSD